VGQVLFEYWPVLMLAFGASVILTPLMRRLAIANGIVDLPDARRKAHAKPVAYLGGLSIFLGWLVGLCVFVALLFTKESGWLERVLGNNLTSITFIALGATAIVITGLFDDVYGIRARVKIGGQLFAAAAIAQARAIDDLVQRSLDILHIQAPEPIMQIIGTLMIAVLVVGCCNAMNLIDGLDGLSSGVTVIAMSGMLTICLIVLARYGQEEAILGQLGIPMLLAIATIGATLGFLIYNFNPASIFMGDTGSLLLGYLCVTTILFIGRLDNNAGLAPLVFTGAVMCFSLPLTDTALAIIRRRLQGKPIFAPDAMHMHHMFRRSGLSVKQSVFAMYALGLIFAVSGVGLVALSVHWSISLAIFASVVIAIITIGFLVSCRLQRSESAHPQPAEAPGTPTATPPTLS